MCTEQTVNVVCAQSRQLILYVHRAGSQSCMWTEQTANVLCAQSRQIILFVHKTDS